MKKLAIALALTVSLTQVALATNTSLQDYRQGDFKKSESGLKVLITQKNKEALFYYGTMKLNGYGVKKNTDEALSLIKQSALLGNIEAQIFLGKYSLDISKNSQRAFYWFKMAADKGNISAQLFTAGAYQNGFGVKKSDSLKNKYLIRAARNGSKVAQYYLGKNFIQKNTYRSEKNGLTWLKKSAKQKYLPAYYELMLAYENNYEKRQYWLNKLKAEHSANADYYIGKYFLSFYDRYTKLSSLEWLNSSAQRGNIEAIYTLGVIHQSSDLNLLDDKKAFGEISKAAKLGYLPAQVQLSYMYKKGIGTKINFEKSKQWLEKSSPNKYFKQKNELLNWISHSKESNNKLAAYSYNGILNNWQDDSRTIDGSINQSPKMISLTKNDVFQQKLTFTSPLEIDAYLLADTISLNNKAPRLKLPIYKLLNDDVSAKQVKNTYSRALLGNRQAQFLLGQYHEFGTGVDKNLNAAAQWYFAAAKQNYLPAEYNLGIAFLKGQGVKQNLSKASYWLNRTAFKGNINAQYALGIVYQNGFQSNDRQQTIAPDNNQSDIMYNLASGAGNAKAKYQLANLYSKEKLNSLASEHKKKTKHQQLMSLYEQAYNNGVTQAKLPLAFYYVKKDIAVEKQKWAFNVLKQEVQSGNIQASLLIALMYERGIGTPKNKEQAIRWYKVAAKNNISAAQFALGSYYYLGDSVNKNVNKAKTLLQSAGANGLSFADYNLAVIQSKNNQSPTAYLEKSAQDGYIKSQLYLADKALLDAKSMDNAAKIYNALAKKSSEQAEMKLGYMYQHGIYFDKNMTKAKHFYRKAANKNNAQAQFQLGQMAQLGLKNKPKISNALYWYKRSAANNFIPAMVDLGYLYEQSNSNYKKAAYWYNKAAQKHNGIAQYNLALIFDYGKGNKADKTAAKKLYLEAAKSEVQQAKINIAKYYFRNPENIKSLIQSRYWFNKANEQNSAIAQYHLAQIYEVGLGTTKNINKALDFYQKAAKNGYLDADKSIARLNQLDIKKGSSKKAFTHYQKAALNGDVFAKYQLANMLMYGIGTEKSEKESIELLKELAKNKFKPATIMLDNINLINKQKLAHNKQIARLKKKAEKEGVAFVAPPKLNIAIENPIEKVDVKETSIANFKTPEAMYLYAIQELEQGNLYQSRLILSKLINKFPSFQQAKSTLNFLEQQDQKIKTL